MEILSLLLLRLRDGKTRGIKKGGILEHLTKELIAAAKEEGGYPDSDDEEDEDDMRSTRQYRNKPQQQQYVQKHDDIQSVISHDTSAPSMRQRRTSVGMVGTTAHQGAGRRLRMGVFTK